MTGRERTWAGAATFATLTVVSGVVYILSEQGYLTLQNPHQKDPSPTEPNPTPTPSPTETPQPSLTAVLESGPTSSSTPIPESLEEKNLNKYLGKGNTLTSDYPAWVNVLGDETTGINLVSVDRFKEYFLVRSLKVESGNDEIQGLDRMFGQLSLPVKNIRDRSLNFDWRNDGQGLGFAVADLSVLRTFEDMANVQGSGEESLSPISRLGEDGHYRGWTVVEARDFEKVVLAYVDESLRLEGIKNPKSDPAIQNRRRALFERIIYGDLGVEEINSDDLWQTVNDKFKICETFTSKAKTRSKQPESGRGVLFDPDQEKENNDLEEEVTTKHDSDNDVLVVMVRTPDGFLRVEVYDLGNYPDPLNPDLNPSLEEDEDSRAHGGRFIPCGPGILTNIPYIPLTRTPFIPTLTPTFMSSVTPARTQPPQPTRTPGGTGATPIVPTPKRHGY